MMETGIFGLPKKYNGSEYPPSSLLLEMQEYLISGPERLKTRIQALLETITRK
jgi:hypothetical protein